MNMNKFSIIFLAAVVGVISAYGTVKILIPQDGTRVESQKESVYDRVMRTGTIRCGYVLFNPAVVKDPNTGELSGLYVDVMDKLGNLANLNIEWTEEVTYATAIEGMKTGRYDMLCTVLYEKPNIMKEVEFSTPLYAIQIKAYVQSNDTRFDGDVAKINNPEYKIASIDGTIPFLIANEEFPNAGRLSIPEFSDYSENLLNVETGKADVTFVEDAVYELYNQKNPGVLIPVKDVKPLRIFSVILAVPKQEMAFKTMLDSGIRYMRAQGILDKIIEQYEPVPNAFKRIDTGIIE